MNSKDIIAIQEAFRETYWDLGIYRWMNARKRFNVFGASVPTYLFWLVLCIMTSVVGTTDTLSILLVASLLGVSMKLGEGSLRMMDIAALLAMIGIAAIPNGDGAFFPRLDVFFWFMLLVIAGGIDHTIVGIRLRKFQRKCHSMGYKFPMNELLEICEPVIPS